MADEDLLARYSPYLQYDSLESFRSDSAAILPEHFFDDGSKWSYTNVLKRKGGASSPLRGRRRTETQLDLAFLGKRYASGQVVQDDRLPRRRRAAVRRGRTSAAWRSALRRPRLRPRRPRADGPTWLQYWFFYYYNDKNFFGIGLHEGDWEMIQLRLGRDGEPNAATFAQHRDGEAFNWSDLELRPSPDGDVPVVYVGRGSHASFAERGRALADASAPLRPTTRTARARSSARRSRSSPTTSPAWVLWPGKWGSSDSSPTGPLAEGQWRNPTAFHVEVGGVTRGRDQEDEHVPRRTMPVAAGADAHLRARRGPGRRQVRVPAAAPLGRRPPGADRRLDRHPGRRPAAREPRVHGADADRRLRASACASTTGRYVVRTVAYSEDGVQSELVETDASAPRRAEVAAGEEHFDAVVVGSGFGGSVTAFRLAEAGMRVCLLERGKAYPPGSFPRSPWGTSRNLWDPSEGLHGLFNVWEFRGLGGIVASGLGGGSLLYSNVLIRKDRVDLRAGGPRARRLGALAGHLRGSRAALRAPRGDARRAAVPARAPAVRRHAQDERAPRRRRAPRARVVPAEARRDVRTRRRRARAGRCRSSAERRTCTEPSA